MEQYYKPSGMFSPLSFVFWIIAAVVAFPILAFIYAYAIWYIPFPYINFFITAGFGALIGIVISLLVVKAGKVRNPFLATIFCLLGALVALYVHWAVWVDLALNVSGTVGSDRVGIATSNVKFQEVFALLSNPKGLFEIIGEINKVGVWGIRGGTVSGTFLTVIWVLEALITFVVAYIFGTSQVSKPFCEEENSWFNETNLAPIAHFEDGAGLVKALASGDLDTLSSVLKPVGNPGAEHHAKVTLYDARTGENFVSVSNEIGELNDKKELKFNSVPITDFLKISQSVADKLKSVR